MKDLNYKPYHHHQTSYHPYHHMPQHRQQQHSTHHSTNHIPNVFQQQNQHNQLQQQQQQPQNAQQLLQHYNGLQLTATQQAQQQYFQQQQQQRQHQLMQQQQQQQQQQQHVTPPTHPNYQQTQRHQHHNNQMLFKANNNNHCIYTNNNNSNNNCNNNINNNNNNQNENKQIYNGKTATTSSTTACAATTYTAENSTYLQQQQQQFCNKNYNDFLASYVNSNYNNNSNNNNCNINRNHTNNNLQVTAITTSPSLAQTQQQHAVEPEQRHAPEQIHGREQTQLTDCSTITNNNNNNNNSVDKFTMDANEIVNFLANELFKSQLVSMDGMQSGVPTLTTPTLTPTTLRSIEETFVQLESEPTNIPNQAGFKPPPLAPFSAVAAQAHFAFNTNNLPEYNDQQDTASEDSRTSWNGQNIDDSSQATTDNSSAATDTASMQNGLHGIGNNSLTATSTTSSNNYDFKDALAKNGQLFGTNANGSNDATVGQPASSSRSAGRRGGGRRPTQATNMSPEEEEKRRLRRERNKLAAARCRKRRVDQTNELLDEVSQLEAKRETLQNDISTLSKQREELEYVFKMHLPNCQKLRHNMLDVSPFGDLITPTSTTSAVSFANALITGVDTTLATAGRSMSPIDLKPVILDSDVLQHIKNEPLDHTLDSISSDDGQTSPKRVLPNVASLQASIAAASLNTPIVTTAPVSFTTYGPNATLNALNKMPLGVKRTRPNSLPGPRNLPHLALQVDGKQPTEINGVSINTPSNDFNFESLMVGGTGLTPTSGPLMPTCSTQNKSPLELTTPTSEPSKLVSL